MRNCCNVPGGASLLVRYRNLIGSDWAFLFP